MTEAVENVSGCATAGRERVILLIHREPLCGANRGTERNAEFYR